MTAQKPLSENPPKIRQVLIVECDSLDQIWKAEEGIFDCLTNIMDSKCAKNVGMKGGIQFHRITDEYAELEGAVAAAEARAQDLQQKLAKLHFIEETFRKYEGDREGRLAAAETQRKAALKLVNLYFHEFDHINPERRIRDILRAEGTLEAIEEALGGVEEAKKP